MMNTLFVEIVLTVAASDETVQYFAIIVFKTASDTSLACSIASQASLWLISYQDFGALPESTLKCKKSKS